jgi:hypothetical protein
MCGGLGGKRESSTGKESEPAERDGRGVFGSHEPGGLGVFGGYVEAGRRPSPNFDPKGIFSGTVEGAPVLLLTSGEPSSDDGGSGRSGNPSGRGGVWSIDAGVEARCRVRGGVPKSAEPLEKDMLALEVGFIISDGGGWGRPSSESRSRRS